MNINLVAYVNLVCIFVETKIMKSMTTIKNPFRPGAGLDPPYLAGRTQEKHEFMQLLDNKQGKSLIIYIRLNIRFDGAFRGFHEKNTTTFYQQINTLQEYVRQLLPYSTVKQKSNLHRLLFCFTQLVKGGELSNS